MENNRTLFLTLTTLLLIPILTLSACSSFSSKGKLSQILISSINCSEPRPRLCSKELRPVCATNQDGTFKTYDTGCMACSNNLVQSYKNGACQ